MNEIKSNKLTNFLKKINSSFMEINEKIKEWNQKIYPNPTFVAHNELLKIYPLLNWRKIKKYANIVRTKKVKMLAVAKFIYDPNNPSHKGHDLIDTLQYAKEDFAILLEKEEVIKKNPRMVLDELNTKIGKKVLLRDYRKDSPDLKEMENLSDSFGTFIAFLALEKLKEADFDQNTKTKFIEHLNSIIPPSI